MSDNILKNNEENNKNNEENHTFNLIHVENSTNIENENENENKKIEINKIRWDDSTNLYQQLDRWWVQFYTLLIKNYYVLLRRTYLSFFLFIFPFFIFLVFFQDNENDKMNNIKEGRSIYDPVSLNKWDTCPYEDNDCIRIVYSPNIFPYNLTMKYFANDNHLILNDDIIGLSSFEDVKIYFAENYERIEYLIQFDESFDTNNIILNNDSFYYISPNESPYSNSKIKIWYNESYYIQSQEEKNLDYDIDFAYLYKELGKSIIKTERLNSDNILLDITLDFWSGKNSEFNNTDNSTLNTVCNKEIYEDNGMGLLTILCFTFVFSIYILVPFQILVDEKTKKLLSQLRSLGLLESTHYLSWFIIFAIFTLISLYFTGFIFYLFDLKFFKYIDLSLFVWVTWFYAMALIAEGLFIAGLLQNAGQNTTLAFISFFALSFTTLFVLISNPGSSTKNIFFYEYIADDDDMDSTYYAIETTEGQCVVTPSAIADAYRPSLLGVTVVEIIVFFMPWWKFLHFGSMTFFHYERRMTFGWDNFYDRRKLFDETIIESPNIDSFFFDDFSPNDICGYLFSITILYLILAWFFSLYLDSDAGEGTEIFQILFPFYNEKNSEIILENDIRRHEQKKSSEDKSIRSYKLSKTYKTVQALKELTLNILPNEVFALLGENGAGKSTFIKLLTGVTNPTHGKAYFCGLDIENDIHLIQQRIGVCPQDDLLWDELTSEEHLRLFGTFKGLYSGNELENAIKESLNTVQLYDRKDDFVHSYSGGMKRRLSVALSFIGHMDAILIDEATTGLDPLSKHQVWEAINILKKNKILILTTHDMDEVDALGDIVAFLHNGRLKAIGNPLELKRKYGKGYQIKLFADIKYDEYISGLIKEYFPGAQVEKTIISNRMNISITLSKRFISQLPKIFAWIQNEAKKKHINSWGFSNTTLQEVFIQLCAQNESVNYVHDDDTSYNPDLCLLCKKNKPELVILLTKSGIEFQIPDTICKECSLNPPKFSRINKDDENDDKDNDNNDDIEEEKIIIDENKEIYFNENVEKELIELDNNENEEKKDDNNNENKEKKVNDNNNENEEKKDDNINENNEKKDNNENKENKFSKEEKTKSKHHEIIHDYNYYFNQAIAVTLKNITQQKKRGCANWMTLILIGILLLGLFLIGIFLPSSRGILQCPRGYVAGFTDQLENCEIDELAKYLVDHESELNEFEIYPQVYSNYWVNDNISDWYYIWDGYSNFSKIPNKANNIEYQYDQSYLDNFFYQNEIDVSIYERTSPISILDENQFPFCTTWEPDNGVKLNENDGEILFRTMFTDVGIDGNIIQPLDGRLNVTLYLPNINEDYTYSYANWVNTSLINEIDQNSQSTCPIGINEIEIQTRKFSYPWYHAEEEEGEEETIDNSYNVLSQILVLINSLRGEENIINGNFLNPIKITTAPITPLFYDITFIYKIEAFILSLFCFLIINSLWPQSIYRYSYEIRRDLADFLNAIGVKRISYMLGMFLFDFLINFSFTLAVFGFSVGLKLSRFRVVNFGLLFIVSFASAYGIAGLSILMSHIFPKKSKLATITSIFLTFSTVLTANILTIALYTKNGTWPHALSLIPFFAQSRALFVVLVYNETNEEFNVAILFLFLIGSLSLLIGIILKNDVAQHKIHHYYSLLINNIYNYIYKLKIKNKKYDEHERQIIPQIDDHDIEMQLVNHSIDDNSDEDIAIEYKKTMANDSIDNYAIVNKNFSFAYPTKAYKEKVMVVKNLTLSMEYGEVFGLLGPNGAGKSTAISTYAGLQSPTTGEIYIKGVEITQNRTEVAKVMGLCPQFDKYWDNFTVKEHLVFFARTKGFKGIYLENEIQRVAQLVKLDGDTYESQASTLSGGQRRRMAIGIAILGSPKIVILDEPTTGLDVANRQIIWDIIRKLRSDRTLILLTTHSMQEAEALCTRIGILVKGKLKALGSPLQLKQRYGHGLSLSINIADTSDDNIEQIKKFLKEKIYKGNDMNLIHSINRNRKYNIPQNIITLSKLFQLMENNKSKLNLREWSVSMATLEEAFINIVIAANQEELQK